MTDVSFILDGKMDKNQLGEHFLGNMFFLKTALYVWVVSSKLLKSIA